LCKQRRKKGTWYLVGVNVDKDNKMNRRVAARQEVNPLEINGFTSLDHMTLLSRKGFIVDASSSGFLLHMKRTDLVPKQFRNTLSLKPLEGDQVLLTIPAMNLEIGGVIARTRRISKDLYEIAIDYSADAPEYWRECLVDLLPRPGEFED
jgi:hypothetical protein